MRLATVRHHGTTSAARIDGGEAVLLEAADALAALTADVLPAESGPRLPLAEVDFAPAVVHPAKVVCMGLNYRAHLEEIGIEAPQFPTLFSKFASSLLGANDDLVVPAITEKLDWEVELTAVVGRRVYRAERDEAEAAIGGYTIGNDVTLREWQLRTRQWLPGKAADATTPIGPWIVTPDEIDGARALEIGCQVDGEDVQRSNTSDLLFAPADLVAYISQFTALEPGDLVLTGTPSGVGDMRKPPRYLRPGQVLRSWIEGIGECVNHTVPDPWTPAAGA